MPRNTKNDPEEERSAADYYRLKTEAVDDLIHANEENSPPVSEEELQKYRGKKFHIPNVVKVLFVKFWFPAAVCYFFFWGLGSYMVMLDLLVATGIALGVVTDLLTNNVLRFIEEVPGGNDRWMMVPKKRFRSFFLNILYACVVLFLVYTLYTAINTVILMVGGPQAEILGVGPILFGLFYLLCDSLLLGMKHLFLRIVRDAVEASK